jgi:hypothetical protein
MTNKIIVWTALLIYISLLEYEGNYVSAVDILSKKPGELFSIINDKLKLKVSICQGEFSFFIQPICLFWKAAYQIFPVVRFVHKLLG